MEQYLPVSVTFSANAGIVIGFPNHRKIWIDLFPDEDTPLFSCLSENDWEKIKLDPRFCIPDLVLFTHTHPDHFSAARLKEVNCLWPKVPVYLPEGSLWKEGPKEELSYRLLKEPEEHLTLDGIEITLFKTLHSGREFKDVRHYSMFLKYRGKQIFVSGDALVTGDVLTEKLQCTRTDLAIVTFPWASTSVGREQLVRYVDPGHVLLYHIPGEHYNRAGFREAAENGRELLDCPDVRAFFTPLTEEIFRL